MSTTTEIINGVQIIRGLDIEEYHRHPALSHTKVQHWAEWRNPAKWAAKYIHGEAVEDAEKSHFSEGRGTDTLLYDGEDAYQEQFVVAPTNYPVYKKQTKAEEAAGLAPEVAEYKPWTMAANYCKEWQAAQETKGRTVISSTVDRCIRAGVREVLRNPFAREALDHPGAESQVTFRWEIDGILVQARPDLVNLQTWCWDDLKTTRSFDVVGKNLAFLGYDMQAGLVGDALSRIRGVRYNEGRHVYIEKGLYPMVEVMKIPDINIEYGLARFLDLARQIEECRRTGIWDRVQTQVREIAVPDWLLSKMATRDELRAGDFLPTDDAAESLTDRF